MLSSSSLELYMQETLTVHQTASTRPSFSGRPTGRSSSSGFWAFSTRPTAWRGDAVASPRDIRRIDHDPLPRPTATPTLIGAGQFCATMLFHPVDHRRIHGLDSTPRASSTHCTLPPPPPRRLSNHMDTIGLGVWARQSIRRCFPVRNGRVRKVARIDAWPIGLHHRLRYYSSHYNRLAFCSY